MTIYRLSLLAALATFSLVSEAGPDKKRPKSVEPAKTEEAKAEPAKPQFTIALTCADALNLKTASLELLERPSSTKTRAALKTWAETITPNFVHPPLFTFKVPGLSKQTALEEMAELVRLALIAGIFNDEHIKKAAVKYEGDMNHIQSPEEAKKALLQITNSDFGRMEKLEGQIVRVFENKKKRTLFGGYLEGDLSSTQYGGQFLAIVDSEYSEISIIADGDLFQSFTVDAQDEMGDE